MDLQKLFHSKASRGIHCLGGGTTKSENKEELKLFLLRNPTQIHNKKYK